MNEKEALRIYQKLTDLKDEIDDIADELDDLIEAIFSHCPDGGALNEK